MYTQTFKRNKQTRMNLSRKNKGSKRNANVTVVLKNPSNSTKKKRSKKGKRSGSRSSGLSPLANMLSNPCDGPIAPGIYGGTAGYYLRLHKSTSLAAAGPYASGQKSGYILWWPQRCGFGGSGATGVLGTQANCLMWCSGMGTAPTKAGFGTGNTSFTGSTGAVQDPTTQFATSSTVRDWRCVAACLRLTYIGTTSNARGMVYPILNMPAGNMFNSDASAGATAGDIITQAASPGMRGDGTYEVRYRLDGENANFIRGNDDCPFGTATSTTATDCYVGEDDYGIGFAFNNVSDFNDYQIDFYKVIEWRPRTGSNFPQLERKGTNDPSVLGRVLRELDTRRPGWVTAVKDTAVDVVSRAISNMALGGAGRGGQSITM